MCGVLDPPHRRVLTLQLTTCCKCLAAGVCGVLDPPYCRVLTLQLTTCCKRLAEGVCGALDLPRPRVLTLQLTTCCRRVSTSYISLIYCTHCVHCSTTCCFPLHDACFSSTRRLLFLYTMLACLSQLSFLYVVNASLYLYTHHLLSSNDNACKL